MSGHFRGVLRSTTIATFVAMLLSVTVLPQSYAQTPLGQTRMSLSAPEPDVAFEKKLAANLAVEWSRMPLIRCVETLRSHRGLSILLDRRVDSGQLVDLSSGRGTMVGLLDRLGDQCQLGTVVVAPIVYLAPENEASLLPPLIAAHQLQVRSLPIMARRRLESREVIAWPKLAEPREIVKRIAASRALAVHGLEQIPHDLWSDVKLPPLDAVEQLSYVLFGFEYTFKIHESGDRIELVPISRTQPVTQYFHLSGQTEHLARVISRDFPEAKTEPALRGLRVTAPLEQLAKMADIVDRSSKKLTRSDRRAKDVFTLTVKEQPLSRVLEVLHAKLGLEFEFQSGTEHAKNSLISFSVEKTSLEKLLDVALQEAHLTFKRQSNVIKIMADENAP